MKRILLFLILAALVGGAAHAQTGGQFCVRAFEDRNANGTFDSGEPLLTSGVSADLLNTENIIVASALLSESPTAAQGVICFQFLAPGQYSLIITSADYVPTTPNTVTASISEGTLPTVVEFGGQRVVAEPGGAATDQVADGVDSLTSLINRDMLPRLVVSLLGALLIMAGMVIVGSFIYLVFLRRPQQPVPAYYPPASTSDEIELVEPDADENEPV